MIESSAAMENGLVNGLLGGGAPSSSSETTRTNVTPPPSTVDPAVITVDGSKNTPSTSASTKSRDKGYPYQQQQEQTPQYPPAHIVYKSSIVNGNITDQSDPPTAPHPPTHSREGSWPVGASAPFPGLVGPMPGDPAAFPGALPAPYSYSPSGTPIIMAQPPRSYDPNMIAGGVLPPMMPIFPAQMNYMMSNQDTIGSTGSASSRRSKRKDYPGHRKVHSYNGSFGSMDAAAFFAPPGSVRPLPPTAPRTPRSTTARAGGGRHSRNNSGEFSPVSEIRNLTGGGFRSERSRSNMVPLSPRPLTVDTNGIHAPCLSPRARSLSGDGSFQCGPAAAPMIPPPFMMPNNGIDPGSLNQYQQSPRQMIPNRGVYMGDDDNLLHAPNSLHVSFRGNASDLVADGVYLQNNNQADQKIKKSNRRMHMRQKSAQLLMEQVKGTEQPRLCRDIFFLLLFVFHLLGIVYLGRTYGYESQRLHDETTEESDSSITIVYTNLIYLAGLSGIVGVVISGLTLLLMTSFAQNIVQVALGLAITFSFVWGTMGIGLSPRKIVPVTGIIALALIIAYAFIVWDRIPFAASNLDAGLKGIRSNPGAVIIAFFFQFVALGWSIYYTYVVAGVYDAIQLGNIGGQFEGMNCIIYVLLGISYYWTLNVCLNIVQVTVAGVIGFWWYKPDGDTVSNGSDLWNAFFRSCFFSIGSICFGSFFVGPVRILRQLSAFFRPSDEVSALLCLHECIHCIQTCMASCVDNLSDRFSSWSFTYVGLYGYGFVDAGLHSSELFEKRGWTTIVSDDLVPNVLFMISLAIGGLTGMLAYMLEQIEALSLTSLGVPLMTSFVIGALVGLVVSSVLFGIISSSVNAVIVLFAASPVDFERNHPELSEDMRSAWREVWPGCMDVLDMRLQVGGYLDPRLNASMPPSERHPLLP